MGYTPLPLSTDHPPPLIKMEEVVIIRNLSHTTHKIWKNTIKNDKNHKKINNQLNNFKAEIGKSAKQLQTEQKKTGCL